MPLVQSHCAGSLTRRANHGHPGFKGLGEPVTEAINLTDHYTRKWQQEWVDICGASGDLDFRKARLAREIRKVWPRGPAGDEQFCLFVSQNLDGCRADAMLMKAHSWNDFDETDWRRFGWHSIQFLMRLGKTQRHRVMALMPGDGPYSVRKVKHHAASLGFNAPTLGLGRPTQTETEARFRVVVDCLIDVWAKHPELGPLPAVVRAALPKKILAKMSSKFGARA